MRVQIGVLGNAIDPFEDQAVLLVYPDGAPPGHIPFKVLEAVPRRDSQVRLPDRRIQDLQLPEQCTFDGTGYPPVALVILVKRLQPRISELDSHIARFFLLYDMHNIIVRQMARR